MFAKRILILISLLIIMTVVLAGCFDGNGEQTRAEQMIQEFEDSIREGDRNTLEELLVEDLIFVYQGDRFEGEDAVDYFLDEAETFSNLEATVNIDNVSVNETSGEAFGKITIDEYLKYNIKLEIDKISDDWLVSEINLSLDEGDTGEEWEGELEINLLIDEEAPAGPFTLDAGANIGQFPGGTWVTIFASNIEEELPSETLDSVSVAIFFLKDTGELTWQNSDDFEVIVSIEEDEDFQQISFVAEENSGTTTVDRINGGIAGDFEGSLYNPEYEGEDRENEKLDVKGSFDLE